MIKLVITNSLSNVMILILRIAITLVMTPLIVQSLGNYDYGIWEIVIALIGYMGILDIGIQPAVTKYVAQYNVLKDKAKLHSIYTSSLVLMATVASACFLLFCLIGLLFPQRMHVEAATYTRYTIFFFVLAAQMLITFPGYVFECFHHGFQRYHLPNLVTIVVSLMANTALFILLRSGGGLLSLAFTSLFTAYARYTAYWLLLRSPRFGGFRFDPTHFSWKTLTELATFGTTILIGGVAARIQYETDTLIVGAFLGPAMVAFYAIPRNLVRTAFSVVPAFTQCFMPLFSELHASDDATRSEKVFLVASRYVQAIALLVGIYTYFLALPFLGIWIGVEYATTGAFVLYYLLLDKYLAVITPFSGRYLTAIGRQMIFVKFGWCSAIINLTLSLIFIRLWGISGVALATVIARCLFEPFVIYYVFTFLGISLRKYVLEVIFPNCVPSIATTCVILGLSNYYSFDSYLSILLTVAVTFPIFSLLFLYSSATPSERAIFAKGIKHLVGHKSQTRAHT